MMLPWFIVIGLFGCQCIQSKEKAAVFIKPVADLFFDRLSQYHLNVNVDTIYFNAPLASNNSRYGCLRATQALFNEIVYITQQYGAEICLDSARLFFDAPDRSRMRYFWTHADNLMLLDDLKQAGVDITAFPQPISIDKLSSLHNKDVLTLIRPWYDKVTNTKYSAGTRFVRKPENDATLDYGIRLFDVHDGQIKDAHIPTKLCFIEHDLTPKQRQQAYVNLVKKWVSTSNAIVPYVWGGASIVDVVNDDEFYTENSMLFNEPISYYVRPNCQSPLTGPDCSGLIARAAQIVGIPYFYKNTLTLANHLRAFGRGDDLEDGDLIWYSGHVMIISSVKNNLLIEATGYPSGYGKLHEIPLAKKFADIVTYDDLVRMYFVKKSVKVLHKDKSVLKTVAFKIFKFSSIWHNKASITSSHVSTGSTRAEAK